MPATQQVLSFHLLNEWHKRPTIQYAIHLGFLLNFEYHLTILLFTTYQNRENELQHVNTILNSSFNNRISPNSSGLKKTRVYFSKTSTFKIWSWTRTIHISWDLIKNVKSQAANQTYQIRNFGGKVQKSVLTSPSADLRTTIIKEFESQAVQGWYINSMKLGTQFRCLSLSPLGYTPIHRIQYSCWSSSYYIYI